MKDFIVIDDFMDNPSAVTREFEACTYETVGPDNSWFVSTRKSSFLSEVVKKIEKVMGSKIYDYDGKSEHGNVARYSYGTDKANSILNVHSDPFEYALILYLSEKPKEHSGTNLYEHVDTGVRKRSVVEENLDLKQAVPLNVSYELSKYNAYITVPNKFNRCLIINARLLHGVEGYFGSDISDSRRTLTMFFNKGRSYRT